MFQPLTTDAQGKLLSPESKTLDYKQDLSSPQKVLRTLVAFANSAGGQLVLGVRDDRSVCGIQDPQAEEERLTSLINAHIAPQLLPNIFTATVLDKTLLIVEVPASRQPYYIRSQGLDEGVYLRLGTSTRQADRALVAELERLARGTHYEEEPCPAAALEELDLEGLSQLRGVPTTRDQLVHLGLALIQAGELVPTNAGILVAHPAPDHYLPTAYVQLARFRGTERLHISDHADVYGSVPAAVDPIMDFVLKHAYRKAVFGGIYREDVYSVPVVALRELVVNALVHANYAERGTPIRLAFYDDRIEIENPGTLLPGMTLESMKYVSKLRNPSLAKIFREAHLMEQWGTGIRRVFEELAAAGLPEPRIEEIVDRVRVTVYIQDHSALPKRQSDYDGPGSDYDGPGSDYDGPGSDYDGPGSDYDGPGSDYDGPELQGISAKLLKYLAGGSKTRQEIQLRMGIRSDGYLRRKYLSPLLEAELVELTIPDKPKSKNQQYRLTPKGKRLLARES